MRILIVARSGEGGKHLAEKFFAWAPEGTALLLDQIPGAKPDNNMTHWITWVQDEDSGVAWTHSADMIVRREAAAQTWRIS